MTTTSLPKKKRGGGFASLSEEMRCEIASKGGKAAWILGTAHKWTSEEAQAAGRKGGAKSRRGPAKKKRKKREQMSYQES